MMVVVVEGGTRVIGGRGVGLELPTRWGKMCIFHEYLCSLFVLLLTGRRQCIMGRRRILGAQKVHGRARRLEQ